MIPVSDPALYAEALAQLRAFTARASRASGEDYRGHFAQVFLGLKFWQTAVPSMFSGQGIEAGPLQGFLDDLYAKLSRPANQCVAIVFEGTHLARSGVVGVARAGGQNTWRNNFHLQKGIGCYADASELASPAFLDQSRLDCRHLMPTNPGVLKGATCALALGNPRYRGEDHRKWLKVYPDGRSFANVDLMRDSNFAPWIAPAGERIPILPIIVALYYDADPSLATGQRSVTGLDVLDFATDFSLSPSEFGAYFDQDPGNSSNAALLAGGWGITFSPYTSTAVAAPPRPTPPTRRRAPRRPAAPGMPRTPILSGTPVPPPIATAWWDAETLVKQVLEGRGWTVYHVSRQQLGYDLLAQKGRRTVRIEVKSSSTSCSPVLTAREWQQAKVAGIDYILAIVENFSPSGLNSVFWVEDPANTCVASTRVTNLFAIPRSSWVLATVPAP